MMTLESLPVTQCDRSLDLHVDLMFAMHGGGTVRSRSTFNRNLATCRAT